MKKLNSIKDAATELTKTEFFSFMNKIEAEKRMLMLVCGFLSAVTVVLSLLCYHLVSESKVVVLPPAVDKEFWAANDKFSHAYFEQVGFYIADRVMSVSPISAENSYDTLLPFFSKNAKELVPIKKLLTDQAEFVKKENVYQTFYPLKAIVDSKSSTLTIEGTLRKYIGEFYVHEIESKLAIEYGISQGQFYIKNLEIK